MADFTPQSRLGQVFNTSAATANQVALTVPTSSNKSYRIEARVTNLATDNYDESDTYGIVGLFLNDNGTLAQVGSTQNLHTAIETVGGRDVNFNVSGTNVQLRVSPADTTPLTWLCDVIVQEISKYQANSGWQD